MEEVKEDQGSGEASECGVAVQFGQNKAARRAVDKARNDMEEVVYNKLEEDGGRKMIYK